METRHGIAHYRLVSFGLVFAFLAVLTALLPMRLRSAGLLLASLAFGITIVEAVAALKEPKFDLTGIVEYSKGIPVIGWDNGAPGAYPNRRTDPRTGAVIYDVTYTIDAQQNRLTKSGRSGGSLVFLGDSFTFGQGVGDSDTMPQKLADLLGGQQKVVNLGVSAFSPAQVLAELQTGLKDDVIGKAPVAFVMLTGPIHIVRTSCKESWTIQAPRFEKIDGQLKLVGPCAEGLAAEFRRFQENTAAYRVFIKPLRMQVGRKDIAHYIDIVAEVTRLAKAKYGVETIVPYVGGPVAAPRSLRLKQMGLMPIWVDLEGSGYDDDTIVAELRARGVNVVEMTLRDEIMRGQIVAIPSDGHPTPLAHALRAQMTLAALNEAGVRLRGSSVASATDEDKVSSGKGTPDRHAD